MVAFTNCCTMIGFAYWLMMSTLALMIMGVESSKVVSPFERNLGTPAFKFSDAKQEFPGTKLVLFDEEWCATCDGPDSSVNLTGQNVALFQPYYSEKCFRCGYGKIARMANRTGAVALLWFSYAVPGHEATIFHHRHEFDNAAPYLALEVAEKDCEVILEAMSKGQEVIVDIKATENEWDYYHTHGVYAVHAIGSAASLVVLLIGCRHIMFFLPGFYKERKFVLPIVVLTIEILCSTERLIFTAVDPYLAHMIFSYQVMRFMISITIPIELISSMAIFLTWNDMLNATYRRGHTKFLRKKSKYIFFAGVVLFCAVEVVFDGLTAFMGMVELTASYTIVSTIFLLFASIFTLIYGYRLTRKLRAYSEKLSKSKQSQHSDHESSSAYEEDFEDTSAAVASFTAMEDGASSSFTEGPENSSFYQTSATSVKPKKQRRAPKLQTRDTITEMTWNVMKLAGAMLLTAIAVALFSFDSLRYTPTTRPILVIFVWLALSLQAYFKIMFFARKR